MAVSPLPPALTADKSNVAAKSKLAVNTSSNGSNSYVMVGNDAVYDLAEQMNEIEKNKYIKGKSKKYHAIYNLTHLQARNSERELMPMYTWGPYDQTPLSSSRSRRSK
jgi:hypothetical protein